MNYEIKSLGYRTDFIFNRLDGEVIYRGDYFVAKTTSNPNYFWGNLLLFKRPPKNGDLAKWKKIFLDEFDNPEIYHMTFAWDCPEGKEGEPEEFITDGFELDKAVVLTATEVSLPLKYNKHVVVKPIDLDEYLDRCIDIQVSGVDTRDMTEDSWREFYQISMQQYNVLIKADHGKWFGAFIDGKLVGSLGIFTDGDVARYQLVSTHKGFQRRGVCSSLVYESARYALKEMGARTLVMAADTEYHAARIYESVGFKPDQYQIGLCYWDKTRHK